MKIIVKTLHGLEEVLMKEIEALGGQNIKIRKRAVECEGTLPFLYEANLMLRTALRILVPVYEFTAQNESQLYQNIKAFDWSKYLDVRQTFAIDNTVFSEYFTHSKYAALKMKDAIADQFREKFDMRPSVDVEKPDILFNLHAYQDKFTVSLDSSGRLLSQRGYRNPGHQAPLNEVMAAGLLLLSGWDKTIPLVDPMCGTGTIIIEAVLMALNVPPQINFNDFGFRNWNNFQPMMWNRIKSEAQGKIRSSPLMISGSDIDSNAVALAKSAFKKLRLGRDVQIKQASFEDLIPKSRTGMIITNPPYGERIGEDVEVLYKNLGDTFKNNFSGYDAWVLSSNVAALKQLHLKPTEKISLYNGPLEVQFCKYELYEGSKIEE
ncbi:MAG: class I SAM-dependent RNA methyltransferase [Flammeovirgaceae bacterium]|nr:class I SAM-dependent RNA methyltransferase [Flammeovirgaceae bacterium]